MNKRIDCDAEPFVPEGWTVLEHSKGGILEWDSGKALLFTCAEQKDVLPVAADEVHAQVLRVGVPVMNANVLDHLLQNPELIPITPERMKKWDCVCGAAILFWGTLYLNEDGETVVRGLAVDDEGKWDWAAIAMTSGINDSFPAAVWKVPQAQAA